MADDEGVEQPPGVYKFEVDGKEMKSSHGYSGKGKASYANGDIFEGMFENGAKQGSGMYEYWQHSVNGQPPNEQKKFEGTFQEGLKTGLGMMTYRDGKSFYHGHFQDGKRHGEGTFKYGNGDIYSGQWQKGKKHGKGTYVYAVTKYEITGEWKDGEIVSGKWRLTNGNHYVGGFKKGKPWGDGVWKFPSGTTVEGAYAQAIIPVDDKEPDKSGKPPTETKINWKTAAIITSEE